MELEVYLDTICPWCYVGLRRLESALARHPLPGVAIQWRPFQLNPAMPSEGMSRQVYLAAKFGDATHAKIVYDGVSEAGRAEHIPFAFGRIRRTPNSFDSHRVIRFASAAGAATRAVEALFKAYFLDGFDIGDRDTLIGIGVSVGLDGDELRAYLEGDAECEALRAEEAKARDIGINAVPCTIVDGKYALSGAQPAEAFIRVFQLAQNVETASSESTRLEI